MHLLIPFAHCSSEGCAQALRTLQLPRLQKLLARLQADAAQQVDPLSLSPPHERALAQALGLPLADGLIPWAALQAHQVLGADGAWGFITPCHWHLGSQLVVMNGSALNDLQEPQSRALLAAMQPYFAEDGITLHYQAPTRWLAQSGHFESLATASLDRASGRDVSDWLPRQAGAAALRRLQSEMQMLLHDHPVNESRSALGLPIVNAFWLSGTGRLAPGAGAPVRQSPTVVSSLREPALSEDWPAWAQAWQGLDATECAALLQALDQGHHVELTLCGERAAQTLRSHSSGALTRLRRLFQTPSLRRFLEPL